MKKKDRKSDGVMESAERAAKKSFPVTRAKALRRLGRRKGLLAGKVSSPLLSWIGGYLKLNAGLSATYAALFAEALDHNGFASLDGIAKRHRVEGEGRLDLAAAVDKLRRAGLVVDRDADRIKPSTLLDPIAVLDSVVFAEVLNGGDSDSRVDFTDPLSVVNEADALIKLCLGREISRQVFFSRLSRLAAKSRGRNPLGEWLKGMPPVETALFFMAAAFAAFMPCGFDMDDFLQNCQLPLGERGRFLRHIKEGRSLAEKRGLVHFKNKGRTGTLAFRLAPKLTDMLYPKLRCKAPDEEEDDGRVAGLKPCPQKRSRLFLPPALAGELVALERACSAAGFSRFAAGLESAGLPPGLTILLHGAPGTGKTAAAFNLARAAGRPVLQADMSRVRDKFVGESEKNVRAIFDQWRSCCKGKGPVPLLLLNEADALVGRRIAVRGSVDQMHNVMQNVLLEELEHFDGILAATTNLIDNIDGAFDRRFLYKLRFDLPAENERRRIWKSRMPEIPEKWVESLSAYPLSGAQIENVARRALLDGLMKKRVRLAGLEEIAAAEGSFRKGKTRIAGFAPAARDHAVKEAS